LTFLQCYDILKFALETTYKTYKTSDTFCQRLGQLKKY